MAANLSDWHRQQAAAIAGSTRDLGPVIQQQTPHADSADLALCVNRAPQVRVSGHAIDCAIQAIGEGVERVEVRPAHAMRNELQALADKIKARNASGRQPQVTRPLPGPLKPVFAPARSNYSKCATCGDSWDECCCGSRT